MEYVVIIFVMIMAFAMVAYQWLVGLLGVMIIATAIAWVASVVYEHILKDEKGYAKVYTAFYMMRMVSIILGVVLGIIGLIFKGF